VTAKKETGAGTSLVPVALLEMLNNVVLIISTDRRFLGKKGRELRPNSEPLSP